MSTTYTLTFGSGNPTGFSGLSPSMLIFYNLATGATVAPPTISEAPVGWGVYKFTYGVTQPIWFLADACTTSPGPVGRYVVGKIDPADTIDQIAATLTAIGFSSLVYGSSIFALGTSSVALGTTSVALGITGVAIGTSIYALEQSLGSSQSSIGSTISGMAATLVALGNTLGNIGASLTVVVPGFGSTASSIGGNGTYPIDLFGYLMRIDALIEGQQQFIKGSGALTLYDLTGSTILSTRTITNSASLVTKQ